MSTMTSGLQIRQPRPAPILDRWRAVPAGAGRVAARAAAPRERSGGDGDLVALCLCGALILLAVVLIAGHWPAAGADCAVGGGDGFYAAAADLLGRSRTLFCTGG